MIHIIHNYIAEKSNSGKLKMDARNILGNNNESALFDIKVQNVMEGTLPCYAKTLRELPYDNAMTIVNFIMSLNTEINPSSNYRRDNVRMLCLLSKFYDNEKKFQNMCRQDILNFLDSYRKPEAVDPFHKWIGTNNLFRTLLIRFFKWLYFPNIENKKRTKPPVVQNISLLKRKEQSTYKPTDLWTAEDDLLFLKYCPSKRMKCYHTMSSDLSARPSEILHLRIKDIVWKRSEDKQYAEVLVNGKTGTRPLLLVDSIPYVKDYINSEHPQPSNPNAPLIRGISKTFGRKIAEHTLLTIYDNYKKNLFPKLLESPNVLPEDKQKIRELLKKPWNPYIRRHSALTEKSKILKEHVLRQHAGWSGNSKMHLKYLHYYGNESNESLLEAYGITKGKNYIQKQQLRPKQCPQCNEPNKPDSKYCVKCGLVLSYDAYSEILGEKKTKDKEVESLKQQMVSMHEAQKEILCLLKDPQKLVAILKAYQ
jgi:integrase/recombinase XerD